MMTPARRPEAAALLTLVAAIVFAGTHRADAGTPTSAAGRFFAVAQKARTELQRGRYKQAAAAYSGFVSKSPQGSYAAASLLEQGLIAAWYLKDAAGAEKTYRRVLQLAGRDGLGLACSETARRHLARIDLIRVRAAVRKYYLRKIEFPVKLSALIEPGHLAKDKLVDPWGKPWKYRRKASDLFPDMEGQEHDLWSENLGQKPPQGKVLKQQWIGFLRRFALWATASDGAGGSVARIEYLAADSEEKRKITLKQGEQIEGLKLVHVTPEGAVLSSSDFLLYLPLRATGF